MIPLGAIPWKLVGWGLLVAAIALMGWRVSTWRAAYQELPKVEAALEAERECLQGSECAARAAAIESAAEAEREKSRREYEQELAELRSRPIPKRVIRVCPDSGDLQNAHAAGGADAGSPAEGVVHGESELDTLPIRELALKADEVTAQCRRLIKWNEAMGK